MILKTLRLLSQVLQLPLIEYDERDLLQNISLALQEYLVASNARIKYPLSNETARPDYRSSDASYEKFSLDVKTGLCLMLSQLFLLINSSDAATAFNMRILEVLENICHRSHDIRPLVVSS